MPTRARTFTYDVTVDREWAARSALGGAVLEDDPEAWMPEHLVLAGLCRCILTSVRYHARHAGLELTGAAAAHGVVTRRDEDGRFAFVEIRVDADLELAAAAEPELHDVIASGERDCFVGASLTVKPDYHWTLNGEDLS